MRIARSALALASSIAIAASAFSIAPSAAAGEHFTVQTLHFAVNVGPNDDQACDVIGDLYLPKSASKKKRVPAILATNGFGGSKDDLAGIGRTFTKRGYAVLSYSGLGFGGSGCKITLDDPDFDGKAARQLVSFLGGKKGIAFKDAAHTEAVPTLKVIQRDKRDNNGKKSTNDPRLGMVGGSYGGQIQYAAASIDKRIDAIIPIITWNDLSYSLGPNNTNQTSGVSSATPGTPKLIWALGFSALGIANGVQNGQSDPSRLIGCPNFADFVCPTLVTAGATGVISQSSIDALRHASVSTYIKEIKIPTLIVQGQNDTLFNINEAVATYQALQKQGTETKMVWQLGGHSGAQAPGELSYGSPDVKNQYVTQRISQWFDRHLKGKKKVKTGPEFSYFRDWVSYDGIATPAYGTSSKYPAGGTKKYYLSAGESLVTQPEAVEAGSANFLTPVAGIPTSTDVLDVFGDSIPLPEIDLPGTFAQWNSAALSSRVDVAGIPKVTLQLDAPTVAVTQAVPEGKLVIFVKLADVDADGNATVIRNLIAPVRVDDVTKKFTVTLPGIVHRFEKGHTIRLIVAGGSTNYRGGLVPTPVTIATGSAAQVLSLPVVK